MAQLIKNLLAVLETWVKSLGWKDPLEKVMTTHSSILAWRIPWTIYSPWSHKESDATERLSFHSTFGLPSSSAGKESSCKGRDPGSILGQEVPLEKR